MTFPFWCMSWGWQYVPFPLHLSNFPLTHKALLISNYYSLSHVLHWSCAWKLFYSIVAFLQTSSLADCNGQGRITMSLLSMLTGVHSVSFPKNLLAMANFIFKYCRGDLWENKSPWTNAWYQFPDLLYTKGKHSTALFLYTFYCGNRMFTSKSSAY